MKGLAAFDCESLMHARHQTSDNSAPEPQMPQLGHFENALSSKRVLEMSVAPCVSGIQFSYRGTRQSQKSVSKQNSDPAQVLAMADRLFDRTLSKPASNWFASLFQILSLRTPWPLRFQCWLHRSSVDAVVRLIKGPVRTNCLQDSSVTFNPARCTAAVFVQEISVQ